MTANGHWGTKGITTVEYTDLSDDSSLDEELRQRLATVAQWTSTDTSNSGGEARFDIMHTGASRQRMCVDMRFDELGGGTTFYLAEKLGGQSGNSLSDILSISDAGEIVVSGVEDTYFVA